MLTSTSHATVARRDATVQRALQRAPILAELPEAVRVGLSANASLTRLPRRATIHGELPGLYVVASGRVRIVTRVGDRTVTIGYVGAGGVFGEECITGATIMPDVIVMDAAELVRIPVTHVHEALQSMPSAAMALVRLHARRRTELEQRLVGVLTLTVEARVATFILGAAREHGIPDSRGTLVGEKFTHLEIAEYIGATRETVTLVLGALRRDNLIDIEHRRLVVRDEAGLKSRAAGDSGDA